MPAQSHRNGATMARFSEPRSMSILYSLACRRPALDAKVYVRRYMRNDARPGVHARITGISGTKLRWLPAMPHLLLSRKT
jgi:hypothetical protein